MKTVLVHYKTTKSWGFTFNDDLNSKIVKVNDLEELNDMFDFIENINIIEDSQPIPAPSPTQYPPYDLRDFQVYC